MMVVRNCNSVVKREEGRREEKGRKEERKRGRKRGSERGREMGRMKGVGWEGRKREGKRGEDRDEERAVFLQVSLGHLKAKVAGISSAPYICRQRRREREPTIRESALILMYTQELNVPPQ